MVLLGKGVAQTYDFDKYFSFSSPFFTSFHFTNIYWASHNARGVDEDERLYFQSPLVGPVIEATVDVGDTSDSYTLPIFLLEQIAQHRGFGFCASAVCALLR